MKTVGDEDDDEDEIEDIVDVQDDQNEDVGLTAVHEEEQPKVVDSLELKAEAERVAPRLLIRIPTAKSDWRTHFSQMSQHHQNISTIMQELSPILAKVGADVTKAIELIETREKNLNSRLELSVIEYSRHAKQLEAVETRHKSRVAETDALQAELTETTQKLTKVREDLKSRQSEMSDNSPLMKLKNAISKIKEEIKGLELRSSVLQRSLTQAWLDTPEDFDEEMDLTDDSL